MRSWSTGAQTLEQRSRSGGQNSLRQFVAQSGRVVDAPGDGIAQQSRPIGLRDQTIEDQTPALEASMRGDGRLTAAAESMRERPFGVHRNSSVRVIQHGHEADRARVGAAALDADDPLS